MEGSLVSQSRLRSSASSKEAASRLYRDISPTKVFTASSSGGKSRATTLPDLFKQKNALATLRPAYLVPGEAEEQDPRGAPRLLARCACMRIPVTGLSCHMHMADRCPYRYAWHVAIGPCAMRYGATR